MVHLHGPHGVAIYGSDTFYGGNPPVCGAARVLIAESWRAIAGPIAVPRSAKSGASGGFATSDTAGDDCTLISIRRKGQTTDEPLRNSLSCRCADDRLVDDDETMILRIRLYTLRLRFRTPPLRSDGNRRLVTATSSPPWRTYRVSSRHRTGRQGGATCSAR